MIRRPGQLEVRDGAGAVQGYATTLIAPGATVVNGVADLNGAAASAKGSGTLSAGAATVLNSLVSGDSVILLTGQDANVTGTPYVFSRTPGVGFDIASTNGADSGVVSWAILNGLPAEGVETLSAGAATVLTDKITADSHVQLTGQDANVTGTLYVSARTPGVSFEIASTNGADSGVAGWAIL